MFGGRQHQTLNAPIDPFSQCDKSLAWKKAFFQKLFKAWEVLVRQSSSQERHSQRWILLEDTPSGKTMDRES